jgi:MFS family permease
VAFSSLRPLTSRNFALVWSSALVSNVGSWVQTVALGTLVTLDQHNPFWTAVVMAAGFLPMGLMAPIGGVLADRFDRRRWLMVTTVAESAFAFLLAALVAGGHRSPIFLVVLAFVGSSAGSIGFPAYQALLPDLVEQDDLMAAVSLSSAQWNMGRVLGPAIAGVILVTWSPALAFALNGASFGAVVIALWFVRVPTHVRAPSGEKMWARLREGAAAAAREPGCRAAILLISVLALLAAPFIGLIASLAIDGLHHQAGGPATLTTAQGIGAVVGALSLAPLATRIGHRRVVAVAMISVGVALVLYGLAPNLVLAAVAIALVGGTYICVLSGLNTVVQLRAPEAARGRILSLFMVSLGVLYPIGLMIQGEVARVIGVRVMTILSGLMLLVAIAAIAIFSPRTFEALDTGAHRGVPDASVSEAAEFDPAAGLDLEDLDREHP